MKISWKRPAWINSAKLCGAGDVMVFHTWCNSLSRYMHSVSAWKTFLAVLRMIFQICKCQGGSLVIVARIFEFQPFVITQFHFWCLLTKRLQSINQHMFTINFPSKTSTKCINLRICFIGNFSSDTRFMCDCKNQTTKILSSTQFMISYSNYVNISFEKRTQYVFFLIISSTQENFKWKYEYQSHSIDNAEKVEMQSKNIVDFIFYAKGIESNWSNYLQDICLTEMLAKSWIFKFHLILKFVLFKYLPKQTSIIYNSC